MPHNILANDKRYNNYTIGRYTYGSPKVHGYRNTLEIGHFCSIAEGVEIFLDGQHRTKWITTSPLYHLLISKRVYGKPKYGVSSKGPVVIGSDVWIGYKALILSGVTIGDGAVIGAKSVVSKDIPPYAIAVGSPIVVKKYRFTEEQITELLKIQWWNWPEEKIKQNIKLLLSENIEEFIRTFKV
uniref:Putative hexapeptide repeat-containing transferase n=1 Tax=viral metagenome TaxID=1070528 RepID=A0A6M3KTD4_9ZZZZ